MAQRVLTPTQKTFYGQQQVPSSTGYYHAATRAIKGTQSVPKQRAVSSTRRDAGANGRQQSRAQSRKQSNNTGHLKRYLMDQGLTNNMMGTFIQPSMGHAFSPQAQTSGFMSHHLQTGKAKKSMQGNVTSPLNNRHIGGTNMTSPQNKLEGHGVKIFTPQSREKPSTQQPPKGPTYSNLVAGKYGAQQNSRAKLGNAQAANRVRQVDNFHTIQTSKETAQKLVYSNSNSGLQTLEQKHQQQAAQKKKILHKNINFANSNYHLMDQNLQETGGGTGAAINVKDQRADYRVDESAFTDDMAASSATLPQEEENPNHHRVSGQLIITSSVGSENHIGTGGNSRAEMNNAGKGDIQIVTGEYSLSKVDDVNELSEDAQQLFVNDHSRRRQHATLQAKKSRGNIRGMSGHRSNPRNKPAPKAITLEANQVIPTNMAAKNKTTSNLRNNGRNGQPPAYTYGNFMSPQERVQTGQRNLMSANNQAQLKAQQSANKERAQKSKSDLRRGNNLSPNSQRPGLNAQWLFYGKQPDGNNNSGFAVASPNNRGQNGKNHFYQKRQTQFQQKGQGVLSENTLTPDIPDLPNFQIDLNVNTNPSSELLTTVQAATQKRGGSNLRGAQQKTQNFQYTAATKQPSNISAYQNKSGHNKNFSQTRRNIQAPKLDQPQFGDRQIFSALQSPVGQLGPATFNNRPAMTYESQLAGPIDAKRLPHTSPSHRVANLNKPKGIAGKKLSQSFLMHHQMKRQLLQSAGYNQGSRYHGPGMGAYATKNAGSDENIEEQFNSLILDTTHNAQPTNLSGSNCLEQALQDHLNKDKFDKSPSSHDFKHAFLHPKKEGSSLTQISSTVGNNIARKLRNQGAKKTGGTGGNQEDGIDPARRLEISGILNASLAVPKTEKRTKLSNQNALLSLLSQEDFKDMKTAIHGRMTANDVRDGETHDDGKDASRNMDALSQGVLSQAEEGN